MFTVDGVNYTLKYNTKKVETIETITKTSVVGEITKNNGILPIGALRQLFSFALVEESTNEVVKQSKAIEMFDKLIEENGLMTVNMAIIEKLKDDMGFMFR